MRKNPLKVGDMNYHKKYGLYEVIERISNSRVTIRFVRSGGVVTRDVGCFRSGLIRDPQAPTAYGVGTVGGVPTREGVVRVKSYVAWYGMLTRCYSSKWQEKYPTYVGCSVCEEWLYYPNFKEWFDLRYREGYELDKDIKIEGNKLYSPETCLLVSHTENMRHANRRKYDS